MELSSEFIDITKRYVVNKLHAELPKSCLFHSARHTLDVTNNVEIIGKFCKLHESEINLIKLSALFHDIGYVRYYTNHESYSAFLAEKYLVTAGLSGSQIKKINRAILATQIPQRPEDKYAKILCDADLMHLTYENCLELMELLRKEWEQMNVVSMNEKAFHLNTIKFLNEHKYHTSYGQQELEHKKKITMKRIKQRIKEL